MFSIAVKIHSDMQRMSVELITTDKCTEQPWLTITMAGAAVGMTVTALTFSAAAHASNLTATGTGMAIDGLGAAASMGATFLLGDVAGYSVRAASKVAAGVTEQGIRQSGLIGAGVLAAAAGSIAALSITVGTRIIECSVEYGGKITREMAARLAEEYVRFRAGHTMDEDEGWLLILENSETKLIEVSHDEQPSPDSCPGKIQPLLL